MKLPALWIACAFAAGIGAASRWPGSLRVWLAAILVAMVAGGVLVWRNRVRSAAACALVAWAALGGLAMNLERAGVPANHVTRLIATGRLDLSEPLRWQGRLREDPMALPWGRRYEVELERVQDANGDLPVRGGLRMNLYGASAAADELRAGDRVEALVKARPPRTYLDPGAFDTHAYLAQRGIDLTGSLRNRELLQRLERPAPSFTQQLARARGNLLARLDRLFFGQPERAAVLKAMMLGDRSFVDTGVVTAFQKTAAYHVLVVAGLHVGALVAFLFWLCRRLRFPVGVRSLVALSALAAYAAVVEDRPPILRAALMAAIYLCGHPLFRRVDLLNTVSLAALAILVWKPSSLGDTSFQLSFLAAGVIAGLALPWIERTSTQYRAGLRHLGDATRDSTHPPKIAQFRIDVRAVEGKVKSRLPKRVAAHATRLATAPVRAGLRLWEIVVLSVVIQWGMTPLLARDFHRVSLAGPVGNIPAVILTGLIVPLGFVTLAATFVWTRLALLLARVLGFCTTLLLATVNWFSRIPRASYRIPGPPAWLVLAFFAALILLVVASRMVVAGQRSRAARRQLPPPVRASEWVAAVALAALTVLVLTYPFAPKLARGKLEVSVLDVGQGDSIFAAFPDGRTMLMDGGGIAGAEWIGGQRSGPDVGEEVVSPYLWSRGLKRLDVVALTHAHHDHLDGLHSVLENFSVGALWIGRDEETRAFQSLCEEARARGVSIVHLTEGARFDWHGVRGEVLWPPDSNAVQEASNDNSLVMRLTDDRVRFLLPGDIQQRVEQTLARDGAPLAADFVKVPHHGSKTSSTGDFLAAVAPRVAVISVGAENSFGHPSPNVVERYENAGVRLLRTDQDGAVTALTDGTSLAVHAFAER